MPPNTLFFLGILSSIAISITACENRDSTNGNSSDLITSDTSLSRLNQEMVLDPIEVGFRYAAEADSSALEIADSLIEYGENEAIIAQGHYLKGIYYTNTSATSKALTQFDSTIITNFTFTDAYIEKAILLYDKKKFDLALNTLKKAAELNRYNAEIYFWMAKNYEAKKNKSEAIFYYEQSLLLDKTYEPARHALDKIKKSINTTGKK